MRTTRKQLEAKINNYNSIKTVIMKRKLKLNYDIVGGINLYTEDNVLLATGTYKEISLVLDALITLKHYRG